VRALASVFEARAAPRPQPAAPGVLHREEGSSVRKARDAIELAIEGRVSANAAPKPTQVEEAKAYVLAEEAVEANLPTSDKANSEEEKLDSERQDSTPAHDKENLETEPMQRQYAPAVVCNKAGGSQKTRLSEASTATATTQAHARRREEMQLEALRLKMLQQQEAVMREVQALQDHNQLLEEQIARKRLEHEKSAKEAADAQARRRRSTITQALRRSSLASQVPPGSPESHSQQAVYADRDWMAEQRKMLMQDLYEDADFELPRRKGKRAA